MKKILAFALTILLTLTLTACGASNSSSASGASSSSAPAAISVDEGLFDVEITLPASMVESMFGEDSEETFEEYAERMKTEDGVKNVVQNEDGSITITMTKAAHKKMLDDYKATIDEMIASYTDGDNAPSVKSIEYNSDLTEFTVMVDREAYEGSFDSLVTFALGIAGMYYQAFAGTADAKVTINVVDEATGETVSSVVYPDTLQQDAA